MKKFLIGFLVLLSLQGWSKVKLHGLFGNDMVLQREKALAIWGYATKGEKIKVKFHNQLKTALASQEGKWKVTLSPESAGGPYTLSVKGENSLLLLTGVLVGDVWVCSGQSNMEWNVRSSKDAAIEIPSANYPLIRHIEIPHRIASLPEENIIPSSWKVCSAETVANFTAVGYFFARDLTRELNVPIGLINSSWGGTHVETWTSNEAFKSEPEFNVLLKSMPRINLDSLVKVKTKTAEQRILQLQKSLRHSAAEISEWKNLSFTDSEWPSMNVPELWEAQSLGNLDGVVWFRKDFNLDKLPIGDALLALCKIDDTDETYVNGIKVGETNSYNDSRAYKIAPTILKLGRNVIAIRVVDTGGGGGIYGKKEALSFSAVNQTIPLAGNWKYQVEEIKISNSSSPNSFASLLYNGMINPLIQFPIKGVIWYQGEANAGRAFQYRKSFPLMITDWRSKWQLGDFPFYFVQLASFNAGNGDSNHGSSWAELREAQTKTLQLPNTGMAVTIDIGEPADIHPKNKQDVGHRLARIALKNTYGKEMTDKGPVYTRFEIADENIFISFVNIENGFSVKDKYGYIRGFEISGDDHVFHFAQAEIIDTKIKVHNATVKNPKSVRYAWSDDASDCNLYNKNGLPAQPFRTDDWLGITEKLKFEIED